MASSEFIRDGNVSLLRIDDLDRPLFRIFPLWFFEYTLRVNGGCLVLVPPHKWEDPFEDICSKMTLCVQGRSQTPFEQYLQPAYAQCWSFEGESDALLRAYSRVLKDPFSQRNEYPRYEGVQVRTTPRKLIAALKEFAEGRGDPSMNFHLGSIEYLDNPSQRITNGVARVGPRAMGQGDNRARGLLMKRPAFRHEEEVRLIAVRPKRGGDTFIVNIKPNEVFEEIRFDPRLATFERNEREQQARDLGFQGKVNTSPTYQKAFFQVLLPHTWEDDGEIPGASPAES